MFRRQGIRGEAAGGAAVAREDETESGPARDGAAAASFRRAARRSTVVALGAVVLVLAALAVTGTPRAASATDADIPMRIVRPGSPPDLVHGVRAVFVLARQRTDLADYALAVSDPGSGVYGRHRSVEEIAAAFGASRATIERVVRFLDSFGAPAAIDVTRTFATTLLTRAQADAIFGADPGFTPSVPAELEGAVTTIFGTFRHAEAALQLPRRPRPDRILADAAAPWPAWNRISGSPAPCPGGPEACTNPFPHPGPAAAYRTFTHDQLRTAYGIDATGLRGRGRSAVVVEWGENVDPADLAAFLDGFGLPSLPFEQVLIEGPASAVTPGGEATLDVQTLAGMAPDLDRVTLITAPARTDEEYATYWPIVYATALDRRQTGGRLTDVVSTSWGLECEQSGMVDPVVDTLETIFQTAAAAGVTLSMAAGDQGSSGCASRNPPFQPSDLAIGYPMSSPWVTAVGGTSLELRDDNSIHDARVWNDWALQLEQAIPQQGCASPPCRPLPVWAGSGGESASFARPSWQTGATVAESTGRLVPDVAFLADVYPGVAMYFDGKWDAGNGTSQAAPIFASLALLMNESNARAGRPRIGFASPLIYRLAARAPGAFFDVVEGDNVIGDQEMQFAVDCCTASEGYDLASGWGSLFLDETLRALASRSIGETRRRALGERGARSSPR